MPKYLYTGGYSVDGVKGLLKEGGSGRIEAVGKLIASVGGTLEGTYFAFGEDDFLIICDLPDDETAAGAALAVGSTGAVNIKTTKLLTPEQIDTATKVSVEYRPPGKK